MSTPPVVQWKGRGRGTSRFIGAGFGSGLAYIQRHPYRRVIYALLLTNLTSVLLFGLRLIGAENARYWFMLWNLLLAWVAPIVAWWLVRRLRTTPWRSWKNILLTVIWAGFLPNSFYMVSDLIHVQQTGEVSIIFDAVLFTSFIFNGFIAGYLGVFLIHRELLKRMSLLRSYGLIVLLFGLCGYAIYLGRVQRWNTWDILFQPAGIIFDVSDDILNPLSHPQAFVVTLSFMLLISVFYVLAWEFLRAWLPAHKPRHDR